MARRRLESAIQAGKAIQQGQEANISCKRVDKQLKLETDEERDGVFSLQFSLDGSLLALGYGNGSIQTVHAATGQLHQELRLGKTSGLAVTVLRFNPRKEHEVWAGSSEGAVYAANTKDGICRLLLMEAKNEINCLDFCEDGGTFATAGKDLNIRLYDTETLELITTYAGIQGCRVGDDVTGHAQRVFALKCHPEENNVFITAGWDNTLRVWDSRTQTGLQWLVAGPHVAGDGLDIKGSQILTSSWVYTDALQLWDYGERSLIQTIPYQHHDKGAYLYCGQFCNSEVVAAGGSGTHSVQLINMHTGKLLNELELNRPVFALDSTQQGRQLAVGGASTTSLLATLG